MARKRAAGGSPVLRVLTAAGLGVEAYVHIHLAPKYDGGTGSAGISQGLLFRVVGAVAILMALLVLASGGRVVQFLAFLVSAVTLGAVLLYRYSDVGALGPLPNMHDPTWFGLKTLSAASEAVATLTSAALVLRRRSGATKRVAPARP
ncbi:MAG TPA: hypothetical protein VF892_04510 [Pseudonocardiaceae bacterium]